ncbi:hypothetical protein F5Y03DRAFT_359047 [Xylaria venustula]|nr:hypothetical protein F5Y03DRAFT_359047 [Xylaria venustula]
MAETSPFFTMPPEIRLKVYRFTFQTADGFIHHLLPPPLARVNRLMRNEVLPEYYEKNKFHIQLPYQVNAYFCAYHVRCDLVAQFIPMIKMLRVKIVGTEWFMDFHTTPPKPKPTPTEDEKLASIMMNGAWSNQSDLDDVYRRLETALFGAEGGHERMQQIVDHLERSKELQRVGYEDIVQMVNRLSKSGHVFDKCIVLEALDALLYRSYLANGCLYVISWYNLRKPFSQRRL